MRSGLPRDIDIAMLKLLGKKPEHRFATWGELAARAQIDAGDTPAATPVQRLITGAGVVSSGNLGSTERPCDYGSACGGCACAPQ